MLNKYFLISWELACRDEGCSMDQLINLGIKLDQYCQSKVTSPNQKVNKSPVKMQHTMVHIQEKHSFRALVSSFQPQVEKLPDIIPVRALDRQLIVGGLLAGLQYH